MTIEKLELSIETEKEYTVGQLAADWWWMDDYLVSTGRATWSDANFSRTGSVMLSRLKVTDDSHLKQVNRYLDPDTKVLLVPHKSD